MRAEPNIPSSHEKRLIHTAFGWYALTREQSDLGPFHSIKEASEALTRHIRAYKGVNTRNDRHGKPHSGISLHDSAHCDKTNCALCAEAYILHQTMIAS
jgi:hypothetical protein